MKFNPNVGSQEEILMKRAINANTSAIADLSDGVQDLIDTTITVANDGSVTIGTTKFTASEIAQLKALAAQ